MSASSDRSNVSPVAVESNPAPKVISVRSKLISGVVVPLATSKPVPTVTLVTVPLIPDIDVPDATILPAASSVTISPLFPERVSTVKSPNEIIPFLATNSFAMCLFY